MCPWKTSRSGTWSWCGRGRRFRWTGSWFRGNRVERPDADFERGTVGVRYDGDRTTVEDIRGAIERAGYALAL